MSFEAKSQIDLACVTDFKLLPLKKHPKTSNKKTPYDTAKTNESYPYYQAA